MKATIFIILSVLLGFSTCYEKSKITHHNRLHHQKQHLNFRNELLTVNGIEVFHNPSNHLVAFANNTQTAAAIFDYTSPLLVLFNGQNGHVVVVNGEMLKLLNESVWVGSTQNFDVFFQNLSSLNAISEKSGQTTPLAQPNEASLNEIKIISSQLGIPGCSAVETLRSISNDLNKFGEIIRGIMTGNNCRMPLSSGISRFTGILRAIFTLFRNAGGGFMSVVPALIRNGTQQDWRQIFVSTTGIETFLRTLRLFSNQLDFSQNFGRLLNEGSNLFRLITQFGTNNQANGIDNAFRIVSKVFQARNGQISIDRLMTNLLKIGQNGALQFNNATFASILQEFRQITEIQNSNFHNVQQLQGFHNIIKGLQEGNLNLDGVNVCRIFQLFTSGQITNAIDLGVRVLLQLNQQFNPIVAIPRFFGHLILSFLNSTNGSNLIPGLDPNQIISILPQNIRELLQNRTALLNIVQNSNFSSIFNTISSALNQASNGSLNLGNLLQDFNHSINANPIIHGINNIFSGVIHSFQQDTSPATVSSLSDVTSTPDETSLDALGSNSSQTPPSNLGNLISALQSGLHLSTETTTTLNSSTDPEISARNHGRKNIRKKLGEKSVHSKESRSHSFHTRSHKEVGHDNTKEKSH